MRYVSAAEGGELLRGGAVGLLPTETVVGLVAGEGGFGRLSEIKDRDPGKPIALLCTTAEEAFALARTVPPLARSLAERCWPGPLTLVLDSVRGGTVGMRVPDHLVALAVLEAFGGPLYATSANPSGGPPPRTLEDVDRTIRAAVELAVPGEPGSGEASAVVDLSGGQARLLRPTEELTADALLRLTKGLA